MPADARRLPAIREHPIVETSPVVSSSLHIEIDRAKAAEQDKLKELDQMAGGEGAAE